MDFFGGLAKNIGNFFNGIFGNDDEEEKKRRQREQQKAQQQKKPARNSAEQFQQTQFGSAATPKVTQPNPTLQPQSKPQTPNTRDFARLDDVMTSKPQQVKAVGQTYTKQADGSYTNSAGQRRTAEQVRRFMQLDKEEKDTQDKIKRDELIGNITQPFSAAKEVVVEPIARVPETVVRSGAQLIDPQGNYDATANTGLRRFLYGDEAVKTYQTQGKEADEMIKELSNGNVDIPAPLLAIGLAGLDIGGVGIAAAGKNVAKGAIEKGIVNSTREALGKRSFDEVVKETSKNIVKKLEDDSGKKIPEDQAERITQKVADQLNNHTEIKQLVDEPNLNIGTKSAPAPNAPKSREDVANSYKDIYNTITQDPNLAPETKVNLIEEAKARHAELLKQIDDSAVSQEKLVNDVAQADAAKQADLQQQVEQTQQPVAPAEGTVVTPQDAPTTDAGVSDAAYRDMQDARQSKYDQGTIKTAYDATKREVIDPRSVQQKLDNQEYKRLKQEGLLPKGQRELAGKQSLVQLRGRIENPGRAAEVRDNVKYQVGDNQYSLNDIIRFYGKDDKQKARDFEQYRLYKDELERIYRGADNTIGVNPKEMAAYVQGYERANPLAQEHNAVLRAVSLDALQNKVDARIDDPGLLEAAKNFDYYNPRQALDPENLKRPYVAGGVRSGAKKTQLRSETAGGEVRSPLSLFKQRSMETERALAQQDYDMLIRDMARNGKDGFREVVNADTAVAHRQAIRNMRDLSESIKQLQAVGKTARKDAKAQKQVDAAKSDAITLVKDYLRNQATDEKGLKFADKIKDKEALDLFNFMTESGEVNGKRLLNKISKDSGIEADRIKEFATGVQQEIRDAKNFRTDEFNNMLETTQNLERGTQTITYRLDGETGKVEIPADLAEELSKANEAMTLSPLEKGVQGVAAAQKATWTGALSPVFKAYNVLVKNPLLMYRNADGLSGVDPRNLGAALGDLFNTPKMATFKDEMVKRGASYENALQTRNLMSTTADDIAARAGLIEFFNRNPVSTLQDVWKGISTILAKPDNMQRTAVMYGAYKRAKRLGATEEQALDQASQAAAKVFGDFDRVSRLARNAEAILPYSGAIQAGARSLGRATKVKPLETAIKDATFLATAGGFAAYSMQNNDQYYQDMIDAGKEYELDTNWTIVLPGATRNEDGTWNGVVKIPLTPDLRPYNRAVWRSVYETTHDGQVNPALLAGELFNEFTGDISNSIYDQSKTDSGNNPLNGFMSGSPAGNLVKVAAGVDPNTGKPLADEFTASKARTDQMNDYTSSGAKAVSTATGGVVTPLQVDAYLNQLGNTGDLLQGDRGEQKSDPWGAFFNFKKPITPGKGMSEKSKSGKQFYQDLDVVKGTIDDEKTFKEFEALHSKGAEGEKKNLLTSAQKASQFMSYTGDGAFTTTPLFEAERKLDAIKRARGEAGNPIFDLAPQELQKVLTYRQGKIYNSAKQNYTKNGEGAFQSLGLDSKWYSDFQDAESAYYKSIFGGNDSEQVSFSGKKIPQLTPEQQATQDQYFALRDAGNDGGARALLNANQWMKDYWAEKNDFSNEERKALGFNQVEDQYSSGKGGYGYGGGGDYVDSENALNRILNEGGDFSRLNDLTESEKEIVLNLQKLFAPRRGGRASVTIGGRASGNPRQ